MTTPMRMWTVNETLMAPWVMITLTKKNMVLREAISGQAMVAAIAVIQTHTGKVSVGKSKEELLVIAVMT